MKNIILIGMMGCGKTTTGNLLAQMLERELVDTDQLIEQREGRSISDIFAQSGEGYFRDQELGVCEELALKRNLIISCGGGLPLRPDCISSLKYNGLVFLLDRDPGEIYDSLETSARPLAQQGRDAFLDRFAQRAPIYQEWADYIISDAKSPEASAQAIITILNEEEGAP